MTDAKAFVFTDFLALVARDCQLNPKVRVTVLVHKESHARADLPVNAQSFMAG